MKQTWFFKSVYSAIVKWKNKSILEWQQKWLNSSVHYTWIYMIILKHNNKNDHGHASVPLFLHSIIYSLLFLFCFCQLPKNVINHDKSHHNNNLIPITLSTITMITTTTIMISVTRIMTTTMQTNHDINYDSNDNYTYHRVSWYFW